MLKVVQEEFTYVNDPAFTEMMTGPEWMIQGVFPGGDCFAEGTLLLTEDYQLVPIEKIEVGNRIWGLDRWVRVEAAVSKGTLPIDVVILNNGSQLRLTSNHHVNVLICPKHPHPKDPDVKPCSCRVKDRVQEVMRVSQLQPGMVLATPDRLPFGHDKDLTDERAYVEGLYIADGWCEENRFAISGKDGFPKETQKAEVKAICDNLGLHTYWHERYIRVNDPVWTCRVGTMGKHAPEKHLLSINLNQSQVEQTLRGVMADSGQNQCGSHTLTTTSRLLAVQTRVLHKMMGQSCGWQYIENHGGLGKHPIWRLTPRLKDTNGSGSAKLLRVRSIERHVEEVPCFDVQTEDHNVYLPEHDVTVRNCDDLVGLLVACFLAMLASVGVRCAVIGHSYDEDHNIAHVLCAIYVKGKWIYADPCTRLPLGDIALKPTWELVVDPMSPEKPFCDATSCLVGPRAAKPPRIHDAGDFVGVAGLPREDDIEVLDPIDFDDTQDMSTHLMSANSLLREVAPEDDTLLGVGCRPRFDVLFPLEGDFAGPPRLPKGSCGHEGCSQGSCHWPRGALPMDLPVPGGPALDMPPVAPQPLIIAGPDLWTRPSDELEGDHSLVGSPLEDVRCAGARYPRPRFLLEELEPSQEPQQMLVELTQTGDPSQDLASAFGVHLGIMREGLQLSLQELSLSYEKLRQTLTEQGEPFPPNIPNMFGPAEAKIIQDATQFASVALQVSEQVLNGERELAYAEVDGEVQLSIKTLAGDTFRYVAGKALSTVGLDTFLPQLVDVSGDTQVGTGILPLLLPLISGGSVMMTLGMIFDTRGTIELMHFTVEKVISWLKQRESRKMLETGADPDKIIKLQKDASDAEINLKKEENERLKLRLAELELEKKKATDMYDRLIKIGIIGLVVAGGVWAWKTFGGYVPTSAPGSTRAAPKAPTPSEQEDVAPTRRQSIPPTMVSPR